MKSITLRELKENVRYALVISPFGDPYESSRMVIGNIDTVKSVLFKSFSIDGDDIMEGDDWWIDEIESNNESGEWDTFCIFELENYLLEVCKKVGS